MVEFKNIDRKTTLTHRWEEWEYARCLNKKVKLPTERLFGFFIWWRGKDASLYYYRYANCHCWFFSSIQSRVDRPWRWDDLWYDTEYDITLVGGLGLATVPGYPVFCDFADTVNVYPQAISRDCCDKSHQSCAQKHWDTQIISQPGGGTPTFLIRPLLISNDHF